MWQCHVHDGGIEHDHELSRGDHDEREAKVLRLRFGLDGTEPLTLKEIGQVLSVTESRVSQLHTKAVLRLRGRLRTAQGYAPA